MFFPLILALITITTIFFIIKTKKKKQKIYKSVEDVLISKQFYFKKIIKINKQLSLAINKTEKLLALVENFNYKNPDFYDYKEISASSIIELEKSKNTIKIIYAYNSKVQTALISPTGKEVDNLLYAFFKNSNKEIIENKYLNNSFDFVSASDWQNSYVWAYDSNKAAFVYFRTKEKQRIHKLNLKKEHFILDLKYSYFEAPVLGEAQQLFVYEQDFLKKVFSSLYKNIKQTTSCVYKNSIFYDAFNNIIYIADGDNLLCSLMLNKIKEIYFEGTSIYFEKTEDDKTSKIILHKEVSDEFEKFLIDYNIKKISNNFDAKTDKLINVMPDTKFIIDNSRKRLIYCANLNSLERFNYLIMSFDEVLNASAMKSGQTNYVRIQTKNFKNLDITCKKQELAQFIEAQVNMIVN